jgi:hypothetical protein
MERLSGDEFLNKLEQAVAWDFTTSRDLEPLLVVKDADGKIINSYLEPDTKSMEFDEYMAFAWRVHEMMNSKELKRRRRIS